MQVRWLQLDFPSHGVKLLMVVLKALLFVMVGLVVTAYAQIYFDSPSVPGNPIYNTIPTMSGKSDKAAFVGVAVTAAPVIALAPTNAPTSATTNYGLIAAILGADLNATNAGQNQIATNTNQTAARLNDLITWISTTMVSNTNNLRKAGAGI